VINARIGDETVVDDKLGGSLMPRWAPMIAKSTA